MPLPALESRIDSIIAEPERGATPTGQGARSLR
jgi:hypothetical protein